MMSRKERTDNPPNGIGIGTITIIIGVATSLLCLFLAGHVKEIELWVSRVMGDYGHLRIRLDNGWTRAELPKSDDPNAPRYILKKESVSLIGGDLKQSVATVLYIKNGSSLRSFKLKVPVKSDHIGKSGLASNTLNEISTITKADGKIENNSITISDTDGCKSEFKGYTFDDQSVTESNGVHNYSFMFYWDPTNQSETISYALGEGVDVSRLEVVPAAMFYGKSTRPLHVLTDFEMRQNSFLPIVTLLAVVAGCVVFYISWRRSSPDCKARHYGSSIVLRKGYRLTLPEKDASIAFNKKKPRLSRGFEG